MVVCYNKTVKEKNMEYFAHTRDDGGKRFWKNIQPGEMCAVQLGTCKGKRAYSNRDIVKRRSSAFI